MSRITSVDVRIQFTDRYVPTLRAIGGPELVEGLTLQRGVGCWTLTQDGFAAPGVTGHGIENGYIGTTAREAYATIQTIVKTLEWAQAQGV